MAWKEVTVGEIVELQRGHDLTAVDFRPGEFPVAGSNGIIGYHNKFTTKGPGITLGRSGNSIGIAHYYETDFWAHNTTLYTTKFKNSHPKYIYYLFRLMNLSILNSGSAVPSLNRNFLYSIKINVPDIDEQRSIASILSSLDDKIDLLHRQNATLEAMAEALFKQWFVVEAKEEWEERPLSSIANFLNGLACQKFRPKNFIDRLPVLKIRELSQGIDINSEWATTDIPEQYIIKFGDVIFSWSGSLIVKFWTGTDCILNQHLFKVTSAHYPKWFYYFWCKYHLKDFISIADSKSTTMGHIKRNDLDNAMVFIPSKKELEMMNEQVIPYIDKALQNKKQIRTLEKLRDTLLPKLMSGEVRVKF